MPTSYRERFNHPRFQVTTVENLYDPVLEGDELPEEMTKLLEMNLKNSEGRADNRTDVLGVKDKRLLLDLDSRQPIRFSYYHYDGKMLAP